MELEHLPHLVLDVSFDAMLLPFPTNTRLFESSCKILRVTAVQNLCGNFSRLSMKSEGRSNSAKQKRRLLAAHMHASGVSCGV